MKRSLLTLIASLTLVLPSGCDDCSGPACMDGDAGADSAIDTGTDTDVPDGVGSDGAQDVGPDTAVCPPYVDPNECLASDSCPVADSVSLGIMEVVSVATDEMANPEIVGFIPGSTSRALVVSAVATQLVQLDYTDSTLTIGRNVRINTGSDTAELTSVTIHPSGLYAAITVAEADCGLGRVLLVDIADSAAFADVLMTVDVGFNPDSAKFSPDGDWLVTADEDDREDRPCKPADRMGGTVTIIDVSGGAASASVAQTLVVDHALDSEPEGVAIAPDGTVAIAIQETSELGFFDLDDVPTATLRITTLPAEGGPDGLAFSDDGRWLVVGLERTDRIVVIDADTEMVVTELDLLAEGNVPDEYNRDARRSTKNHEPEGVAILRSSGAAFVAVALQESHSVIVHRLDEATGGLTFDSIAPVGIDWALEMGLREKSNIGPEGVAAQEGTGLILSANEREGSITLLRTAGTMPNDCP